MYGTAHQLISASHCQPSNDFNNWLIWPMEKIFATTLKHLLWSCVIIHRFFFRQMNYIYIFIQLFCCSFQWICSAMGKINTGFKMWICIHVELYFTSNAFLYRKEWYHSKQTKRERHTLTECCVLLHFANILHEWTQTTLILPESKEMCTRSDWQRQSSFFLISLSEMLAEFSFNLTVFF